MNANEVAGHVKLPHQAPPKLIRADRGFVVSAGKTLLTEKSATAVIRKIRKSGFQPDLAKQFILNNAPIEHQGDYVRVWQAFIDEAQATLESDHDYKLHDALSLLRRECNVADE